MRRASGPYRVDRWAIHRKKAQTSRRQAIEMAVGVGHQFIGLLAGGIEAHRVIHRLELVEGHIAVAAINRTTGGIHQILHAVMTAALEDVAKALQVALDVGRKIFKRVTHTSLDRQIRHLQGPFGREQRLYRLTFFQGDLLKMLGTGRCHGLDLLEARLLEAGVAIGVDVVDADHLITELQQPQAKSCTNETGSTGHQNRSGVDGSYDKSANSEKQTDVM